MLPQRVVVREEGPRDGWQNIDEVVIPTETKLAYIDRLAVAGLSRMTVTSFVRPEWVPQLADADAVVAGLRRHPGTSFGVLVPNARGLQCAFAALDAGAPLDEVAFVVSASETHNRHNVNRAIGESLSELGPAIAAARAAGLHVVGGIATVFGCSFEGHVPVDRVVAIARALVDMGVDELSLGDTTGMANPLQVQSTLATLREAVPHTRLTPHFHNTRGVALANIYAALQVGIDSFETAFGELGGCQFAKGATGNVATEDVVSMLHEMDIETGVDLETLIGIARDFGRYLGRPLDGHLVTAGSVRWEAGQAGQASARSVGTTG